jgi:gluconolactonase
MELNGGSRGWQGVFRIRPGARPGEDPQLVVDRYIFSQPNGICFSPCEKWLYVNDTGTGDYPCIRSRLGWKLAQWAHLRLWSARQPAALGFTGWHEMRHGWQCLVHGPWWHMGFAPSGNLIGKVAMPELCQSALGWAGLADALCLRHNFRLRRAGQDRPSS